MSNIVTIKNRIVDFATAKERMDALKCRFLPSKLELPLRNENMVRQKALRKAYVERRAMGRF